MEKDTQSDVIQRRFGHSFIIWKIRNFCFETSRETFLISTPVFSLDGLNPTKWEMTLNPKGKRGEECVFVLTLKRVESGVTSETVFIDLKLWMVDHEGKQCETGRYKYKFGQNQLRELPLQRVSRIREILQLKPYTSGTVTICCQLIVDTEDCYKDVDEPSDIGLKTLSSDLLNLYKTEIDYDIILRVEGRDIYAHKAMLCSRSSVLSNFIRAETETIDLRNLDFKSMQDIILYLYSGNINYIARNPSISTFDCISFLNLSDLKQFYIPQCLEIESIIDVREHTFIWGIKNISLLKRNFIQSPPLSCDYMTTVFRILFYANGVPNSAPGHMAIFAEVVEGTLPEYSVLEFSIKEEDVDFLSARVQLSDGNNQCGFENFLTRDHFKAIMNKLSGDTLFIALKIEIHNDVFYTSENYKVSQSSWPISMFYESLSLRTTRIFHKGMFSDISVEAKGICFRANKCILTVRSPVFSNMINQAKDDKLTIHDMKPHILYVILTYIYSGTYENFELEDIFEVYKAAKRFSLPALLLKCKTILRQNFNVQSICEVLIFSDEQQDTELKTHALNFIRGNKHSVFRDSSWKNIIAERPSLHTDILEFVNDGKDFMEV